ncbi:hypothetical protein [Anaerococcus tetradius]|uniref:hypothetical protein n=1 Tax=Anaerococcus tetradius TaxID=33036 RepID=UPI0023F572EA|nr:hypothetical protein [Anaerococcus tetradius]
MDPLIQIYIDRLAQCDYDNAKLILENQSIQKENEKLKIELAELKESKKEGD